MRFIHNNYFLSKIYIVSIIKGDIIKLSVVIN
nr:MAG TPA: hypothetical protein [Caudoviricetes sp.]